MGYQPGLNDQRRDFRVNMELPVQISIGTQLTLQGSLKDLSAKSAFIRIKHSVFLQMNDTVGFVIQLSPKNAKDAVQGQARISRLVPGEGFAIYFVKMDDGSAQRLKEVLD